MVLTEPMKVLFEVKFYPEDPSSLRDEVARQVSAFSAYLLDFRQCIPTVFTLYNRCLKSTMFLCCRHFVFLQVLKDTTEARYYTTAVYSVAFVVSFRGVC